MNSLYAKCLKPDLTAAESFAYTKADDITDPASEYSKILVTYFKNLWLNKILGSCFKSR
jgi:hypothetical protein